MSEFVLFVDDEQMASSEGPREGAWREIIRYYRDYTEEGKCSIFEVYRFEMNPTLKNPRPGKFETLEYLNQRLMEENYRLYEALMAEDTKDMNPSIRVLAVHLAHQIANGLTGFNLTPGNKWSDMSPEERAEAYLQVFRTDLRRTAAPVASVD